MIQLLTTFFVISLSGALAPGPLSTVAIAEGTRRGKWSGWWLSMGHGLVEGVYVAAIALVLWLGREALLEQPLVAGGIALVGGGFLAWMGGSMAVQAWRYRLTLDGEAAREARFGLVSHRRFFQYQQSLLVGLVGAHHPAVHSPIDGLGRVGGGRPLFDPLVDRHRLAHRPGLGYRLRALHPKAPDLSLGDDWLWRGPVLFLGFRFWLQA